MSRNFHRHLRTGIGSVAIVGRIATSGKHLRQDAGGGKEVANCWHNERHGKKVRHRERQRGDLLATAYAHIYLY